MSQTRTFLIFAWLLVATLLWMEWSKERDAPPPAATATTASNAPTTSTVPAVAATAPAAPAAAAIPAPPAVAMATSTPPADAATVVSVDTDVLRVKLDGGAIRSAELLRYPQTTQAGSAPVRLLDDSAARFFQAQSGWVSSSGAAPSHESGFVPASTNRRFALTPGTDALEVPFVWQGPNGISIRRTYRFGRSDYTVQVRDQVINAGTAPWQGYVYRQLLRVPPIVKTGMTNPEGYSFHGAAWYSAENKFEKRKFADFVDDGPLDRAVTGGWIAMLQYHFFAAWIPAADARSTFSVAAPSQATPQGAGGAQYLIRALGPAVSVAPGATATTQARLWIGPKLVKRIEALGVPGMDRAVDFSSYSLMAALGNALFWLLEKLNRLFGNWGWSIIGLVVLIKLALYPLSAAQYKSMAKMRRFQPRIEQLKQRYGEDKQKFQAAMMELYKKEKINPVGGCLPILLQMPVFLALYWVLLESVELRHAPWIGWIQNLTAPDPYFILPALNMAVMWATQKLSPSPGMDPMQKKMMQFMPLVFGVMFAFFPAGLVLYWVTNGALGLLQQWWMTRRHGDDTLPVKA